MAAYRKKPVVIEAVPVNDVLQDCWHGLPDWIRDAYEAGTVSCPIGAVEIRTLEGTMRGERGDWIIRGVKGELYPCKPDIFAETYEPADALGSEETLKALLRECRTDLETRVKEYDALIARIDEALK